MLQFLARLIAIVVIVSVIRRLIKIALQYWAGFAEAKTRPSAFQEASEAHVSLAQDPVCGTYVAVDTSLKRIVNGKVIHFCSETCRDRFEA